MSEADPDAFPNLAFAIPDEQEALAALLRAEQPTHVELHHWIGHDAAVFDLARSWGFPAMSWYMTMPGSVRGSR